jgi:hypothetical protein
MAAALSSVTMSPESMVSTGFALARKYPICTVFGLGMRVCSAACTMKVPATAASNADAAAADSLRLRAARRGEGAYVGMLISSSWKWCRDRSKNDAAKRTARCR